MLVGKGPPTAARSSSLAAVAGMRTEPTLTPPSSKSIAVYHLPIRWRGGGSELPVAIENERGHTLAKDGVLT